MPAKKPSTGTHSSATLPSTRSIPSASSAGAASPITARDSAEICSSTCSRESISSPASNVPAQRAQSSGGLFHFKDGREFPDLIETLYDYPNFRVTLRCNLNNNGGEFIGFYGTKGTMIIKDTTLTYKPEDTRPEPEGYSVFGWPKCAPRAVSAEVA